MRTLEYEVIGQRLKPIGNHYGLKAGSKGYLWAHFNFSEDWKDCVKVARFFNNGIEYAAKLDSNDSCEIPADALTGSFFEVSVEGRRDDGFTIPSRIIKEKQLGGAK